MTNISVIESKVSSIKKYLRILKDYQKYSQKELEKNVTLKGAVERYLYLAVQATIDLAEAIIAFKDFRRPTTYSETFHILQEENFVSQDLADKLINMARFRNIIVHDYEDLDFGIIYDILQNRLVDIEEFLAQTKRKLRL